MTGYQVIRNSLKGFNTGWCDMADDGAYRTYADEICAMAQFYYNEGHLYDNVFTWTDSPAAAAYRTDDRWAWWGDGEPSMAPVEEKPQVNKDLPGDVNADGAVNAADAVTMERYLLGASEEMKAWKNGDLYKDDVIDAFDMVYLRKLLAGEA